MDNGGLQSCDRRHSDAWRQRRILVRQRAAGAPTGARRTRLVPLDVRRRFRFTAAPSRKPRWRYFAATVAFNVATYNYYRGSVITPFHGGPVSPSKHHLDLTEGVLLPDGAVRFHAY